MQNIYMFNIFKYVTNIRQLNIMGYIKTHGQKGDVINIVLGNTYHLHIPHYHIGGV